MARGASLVVTLPEGPNRVVVDVPLEFNALTGVLDSVLVGGRVCTEGIDGIVPR